MVNIVKSPIQYDILLIDLDPTKGSEVFKIRPCLVISPNEMNRNIRTITIAPMTTKSHAYPSRVSITFRGKEGWIMLDQIRAVDKSRVIKSLGSIDNVKISEVKNRLKEIFID